MFLFRLSIVLIAGLILTSPLRGQIFTRLVDQETPLPGLGKELRFLDEKGIPWVSERCVAFQAVEPGESADTQGIYLIRNGMIEVVANFETSIPGVPGLFTALESFSLDSCDVVFRGEGAMTSGVYLKREGMPLEVIVDRNTPAPDGGIFSSFSTPWVEDDAVVFVAETDVCASDSLYKTTSGVIEIVVDTCGETPVPEGLPRESFIDLGETLPILEDGVLTFTGVGDQGTQGVFVEREGMLSTIANSWTPIPGGDGTLFNQFVRYAPTSGGEVVFGAAGLESMPPFSHGGLYRHSPKGGLEVFKDLVDPRLPGWEPEDPVVEFGFWFCAGDLTTLGAVGFTSPATIFLIRGPEISPLISVGDILDGMPVKGLTLIASCFGDRIAFVADFQDGQAIYLVTLLLFEDGFESGDTTAWSSTVS